MLRTSETREASTVSRELLSSSKATFRLIVDDASKQKSGPYPVHINSFAPC